MDVEKILEQLVRVGTVTAVDNGKRVARVKFKDTGITSGWLYVLANRPYIPDYDTAPQRTEYDAEDEVPQSGVTEYVRHRHELKIKPWMPRVNATVLTLYLPVFNADGFILGEIGAFGEIKQ